MPEFHIRPVNSTSILVTIMADCHSLVYDYDFNLYFTHISSNCRAYTLKYRKSNVFKHFYFRIRTIFIFRVQNIFLWPMKRDLVTRTGLIQKFLSVTFF